MARLIATILAAAEVAAVKAEAAGTATVKMEEEETQRERRIYDNDCGFCFKARLIRIE